jgi:hypothetical protein
LRGPQYAMTLDFLNHFDGRKRGLRTESNPHAVAAAPMRHRLKHKSPNGSPGNSLRYRVLPLPNGPGCGVIWILVVPVETVPVPIYHQTSGPRRQNLQRFQKLYDLVLLRRRKRLKSPPRRGRLPVVS